MADVETVATSLADGSFSFAGCLALDKQGSAALYRWAGELFEAPPRGTAWQGPAWPVTPDGPWAGIAPSVDRGWTHEARAESLFGHIVAHLPDGAGALRFSHDSGGRRISGGTMALLSVAVGNRWWRSAQQLLGRPDAVPAWELGHVLSTRACLVWGFDNTGSPGETHLKKHAVFLPVLHTAAWGEDTLMVDVLLAAGADPRQRAPDDTQVLHRVRSVSMLEFLLARGAEPDLPEDPSMALEAWWSATLEPDEAQPLKDRLARWFDENLDAPARPNTRHQALACELGVRAASVHHRVLQQDPALQARWTQGGQPWTWGRMALNFLLQTPPVMHCSLNAQDDPPIDLDATADDHAWIAVLDACVRAHGAGALGEPLLPGVPNVDLLAVLGVASSTLRSLAVHLGGTIGGSPGPVHPSRRDAVARGLIGWRPAVQRLTTPMAPVRPDPGEMWLLHWAKALRWEGDPDAALAVLAHRPSVAARIHSGSETQAFLREAWACFHGPRPGHAGRWLGEFAHAVLRGPTRFTELDPHEEQTLAAWDGSGPCPVEDNVYALLTHALDRFQAAGHGLDDGAQGRRFHAVLQRTLRNRDTDEAVSRVRRHLLERGTAPAARRTGPRL